MKTKLIAVTLLLMMGTILSVQSTFAMAATPFVASVPFEFKVGNQTLPSGTYSFEPLLNLSPGVNVLAIRSTDGRIYTSTVTSSAQGARLQPISSLLFERCGDQYFLSQIWGEGELLGMQLTHTNTNDEPAAQVMSKVVLFVPRSSEHLLASAADRAK